eukprot:g582.t1
MEEEKAKSLRAKWKKQAETMRNGFNEGNGRSSSQVPQADREHRSQQSNWEHGNMCAELGAKSIACITDKGVDLCSMRIAAYRDCLERQRKLRLLENSKRMGPK